MEAFIVVFEAFVRGFHNQTQKVIQKIHSKVYYTRSKGERRYGIRVIRISNK